MRLKSKFESLRKGGFQKSKISSATILYIISTVRLENLYESCTMFLSLGRNPFQGWAPGRAAKIRFARRWQYFSGNVGHFRHHARTYSSVQIFLKRIDGHETYIPGYVLTWCIRKNWSGAKRIHSLRNLHFCNPFTSIFDKHVETQFPLPLYYS